MGRWEIDPVLHSESWKSDILAICTSVVLLRMFPFSDRMYGRVTLRFKTALYGWRKICGSNRTSSVYVICFFQGQFLVRTRLIFQPTFMSAFTLKQCISVTHRRYVSHNICIVQEWPNMILCCKKSQLLAFCTVPYTLLYFTVCLVQSRINNVLLCTTSPHRITVQRADLHTVLIYANRHDLWTLS